MHHAGTSAHERNLRLSFRLIRHRSWPFTIDRFTLRSRRGERADGLPEHGSEELESVVVALPRLEQVENAFGL
jgi:hypothetical protein